MSEFHFSPRPNRAHEIAWMAWGPDAFARAQREDKPILLGISAVWCHWCHVMDETTYSERSVIEAINERFVPVRVDNDERPDVNARYNMGGWPTTAFLTPDGTTLTGATYLPPEQMRRALDEITTFYRDRKAEIAAHVAESHDRRRVQTPGTRETLDATAITRFVDSIVHTYDEEFAGFGDAPKFPQTDMLEYLLTEWRLRGDQRLYEMVARTMRAMSRGGMYDHVEGGFFRYSTTRDWSIPHFEKMAEDHAGLIRVLAQLALWAHTDDVHATLVSTLRYVRTVLRDPQSALFAGSQDADEEYFELPLAERRQRRAPFVDRRSYTNWSAGLASALLWAACALDDDTLATEATATLDALHERLRDGEGLLFHVLAPGEEPRIRGLLTDQVAYVRALLDAHEFTGTSRFLDRAIEHANRTIDAFADDDGGFHDHARSESLLGRLDVNDRPIVENGRFADALLRLSALTENLRYREAADGVLALYAKTFERAGSFASTYAHALRRALEPESVVKLVGTVEETAEFREAARRLPSSLTVVRTIAASDASDVALPSDPHPAAYMCLGTTCGAPVHDASALRASYDAITSSHRTSG